MKQRPIGRTQLFIHNAFATALYQLVIMTYGIVVPRVMLVCYGSEINGLTTSINQLVTYISMVEAGLAGASVYALYKPLAQKEWSRISSVVCATRNFYYKSGYWFSGLITLVAVLFPIWKHVSTISPFMVGVLIFVIGTKGFLEFFTLAKYRALLTADQRTYVISYVSLIQTVLAAAVIYFFSYIRVDIVLLYVMVFTTFLIRSLILVLYSKKHYPKLDLKAIPDNSSLSKRWDAFYLQLLNAAQQGAPVLIVTAMTSSLSVVSIYAIYNMVFTGINGILSIFVSGLSASFGDIIVRKDLKLLQKSMKEFKIVYYAIISIVCAVTAVTLMPFIQIYTRNIVDSEMYNLPLLGILMLVNCLLYNLKTPQGMLIIAAGMYKETRIQSTIQATIIIAGGLILTPFIGVYGVVVASCLSNLYRCIDLSFFVPKYIEKTKPFKTLITMISTVIICIICVIVLSFIPLLEPNTFLQWMLVAGLYLLIACLVIALLSFFFAPKTVCDLYYRIKQLICKEV